MPTNRDYQFHPEPKQALALALGRWVDELFFGGAAGGGKSRWGRAEAVRMATEVPGSRILLLRRTFPQLNKDVVPKLRIEMPPDIAMYNKTEKTWYFTNGSVLELGTMENLEDYYNYQSAEYQLIIFEELTQFLEEQYRYLMSRLRASGPVAVRMAELGWRPRMISTGNPGGVGHGWVKQRFVDRGVRAQPFRTPPTDDDPKPGIRCYIPAYLTDNPHIDPDYADKLDMLDPILARALKFGDWNILKGTRFSQFRYDTHVVQPGDIDIPIIGYPRAVGVDYGLSAPFAAMWGCLLPGGTVYVYRELHQAGLTPAQQAAAILAAEQPGERIMPGRQIPVALDPACWARMPSSPVKLPDPNSPPPQSIAWFYRQAMGGQVLKARNDRIAGWALIDELLRVQPGSALPRLLISSECRNLIRTLPALPRSKQNPEDVDTKADDHDADALRYLLMLLVGSRQERNTPNRAAEIPPPIMADLAGAQF